MTTESDDNTDFEDDVEAAADGDLPVIDDAVRTVLMNQIDAEGSTAPPRLPKCVVPHRYIGSPTPTHELGVRCGFDTMDRPVSVDAITRLVV